MIGFTKEYKANRGNSEPPYDSFYSDLASVISVVSQSYNVYVHQNYEADDIVSALQSPDTFIYSRDKDLKQVPGYHYDISKNDIIKTSDADAEYFLWLQMLMGDHADNIPGIEGVGETTAREILRDVSVNNRREVVIQSYIKKYGNINGLDSFCDTWLLVKMRINRGGYEAEKLQGAYYLRDLLISNLTL
jgi:DNA polymerase-1